MCQARVVLTRARGSESTSSRTERFQEKTTSYGSVSPCYMVVEYSDVDLMCGTVLRENGVVAISYSFGLNFAVSWKWKILLSLK